MAQLVEHAIQVTEVIGSILSNRHFHLKNRSPKSFVIILLHTENVRENGGKKKLKCFGQLPLGTGSQHHMAEKF